MGQCKKGSEAFWRFSLRLFGTDCNLHRFSGFLVYQQEYLSF